MEGHGNGRDRGRRKGRWKLGEGGVREGVDPTKFGRKSMPLFTTVRELIIDTFNTLCICSLPPVPSLTVPVD